MKGKRFFSFLLQLHGKPNEIAKGFALGLFIGMSPFFGLHTFAAIFFSTVLKGNRIASLVGIQITNIFTIPFVYPVTFYAGNWIYPVHPPFSLTADLYGMEIWELVKTVPDVVGTLTIGGVILGLPMAIGSYFMVLHAVKQIQSKNKHRGCQPVRAGFSRKEADRTSGRNRTNHRVNGSTHS